MEPKFKNQSVKLMYQLYQEFDHGEMNDALDGYRSKRTQSELSCNHILFSYVDSLLDQSDLDLTYATLNVLPETLNNLYQEMQKKYLIKKKREQIVKILSAYLSVLALNMHDLDLTCHLSDEEMTWGSHYRIKVNDQDLLPAIYEATSIDDNQLIIDHDALNDAYQSITHVSLKDYMDPIILK